MTIVGSERGRIGSTSRRYVIFVLTALTAMNHVDRQLISILLEPVRVEFQLSDIQLGLLSGIAFAALFSALSVPAAVWAVRHSRRNLIAAAAALWGVMTVLCGVSQTFWQLILARTGVGIGEAGGMAPSQAIISEMHPPGERATAQGALSAGINAGTFVSFIMGGYVGQRYGWRVAFLGAGVLTVALALLLRLTVREPERMIGNVRDTAMVQPSRSIVRDTLRAMWVDPVLRQLCIGAALTAAVAAGTAAWAPSYLARSHKMGIAAIGLYLALVLGLGGALGTWLGGLWSDRLRRRDVRWSLWLVAVVSMATKPLSIGFYLAADTRAALLLFLLPGMTTAVFLGPSIAVLHERVSPHLQPVASAMLALVMSLVGMGLGPLFVGVMSDWVFAGHGESSLRYALVVLQVAGFWGALHFYAAGRHLAPARGVTA